MAKKIASIRELSKLFPLAGRWKDRGFTANNFFVVYITKARHVVFYPNHTASCVGGRTNKQRHGSWEKMLKLHLEM